MKSGNNKSIRAWVSWVGLMVSWLTLVWDDIPKPPNASNPEITSYENEPGSGNQVNDPAGKVQGAE